MKGQIDTVEDDFWTERHHFFTAQFPTYYRKPQQVHGRFHKHPFATDTNMQQLWQSFERYLVQKFPQALTLATPFNDPIAESSEEYQAFLKTLGYSPLAEAAYGKKVQ